MFKRNLSNLIASASAMTAEHIAAFHRDGIVCVPKFISDEDVLMLRGEMTKRIDAEAIQRAAKKASQGGSSGGGGGDADVAPSTQFKPNDPKAHSEDRYFIESAGAVHFFLEDGCTDVSEKTVNKVGHALHTDGGLFQQFTSRPAFGSIVRKLGCSAPSVVQSMYILKPPNIGGEVSPHQDSTWINTKPLSCLGVWFALDDCTINNGCLLGKLGSQWDPLTARCEVPDGSQAGTLHGQLPKVDLDTMTPIECPKGSMVIFGGQTIHASAKNVSPNQRHAFVFHVVDDDCVWNHRNWLHPYLSRLSI